MNIQVIIDTLKKTGELTNPIRKFTLIVTDRSETQGALFFIPISNKEFKILIPAPFHNEILSEESKTTYLNVLNHKEALLLK